jgi:hypothetical protein
MPHPTDPSPPPEPAPPLYSPFGGDLGDPWADTYPDDPTYDQGRAARAYRVRSEGVWSAARDEYVAGAPAETVCERYDLGLSAFRQRARREGWRRRDAEDRAPEPLAYPPEPEAAPPTEALADLAWRSAAQAIRRGRVYEARAWMRLCAELREAVRLEASARRQAEWQAGKADPELDALQAQREAAVARVQAVLDGLPGRKAARNADDEDLDDKTDHTDERRDDRPEGHRERAAVDARLHGLHDDDDVQSPRREPASGRPPTAPQTAAIPAVPDAEPPEDPDDEERAAAVGNITGLHLEPWKRSP